MSKLTILGLAAGFLTTAAFVPQVLNVIRRSKIARRMTATPSTSLSGASRHRTATAKSTGTRTLATKPSNGEPDYCPKPTIWSGSTLIPRPATNVEQAFMF